ncbi:uncharacterized protein [Medicago truncatula]|uniref:uncharacterized protein n=1 Tax=Medicago truncatula TaxID=3880 RepID=UPI00196720B6|nr:uncharacterized protein LOC120577009 [Medicago truncatula]
MEIYEEDTKAHYKIRNERRNKGQQGRPKPYSAPGHKSNVCNGEEKKCFRCGKKGHTIAECKRGDIVCFNCDEEGHLSSQCKKPKKGQASGRVFALAGSITGAVVLVGLGWVAPGGTGGLVVVPDAVAAFDAAAPGTGGGRVISGSCFLFLKRMHNADQQF